MKIYKHWVIEKQKILIDGQEQEITCYGGSNVSIEDARTKAREKAEKIEKNRRRTASLRRSFRHYKEPLRGECLEY